MAPKRGSAKRIAVKTEASNAAGGGSTNANTMMYADLEKKLATIKAHPLMSHVADEPVPSIAQGSRQAPFDKKSFQACMERGDEYLCAGNFFWQRPMVSPTPSVTILNKNIREISQRCYPENEVRNIKHDIHIGIPSLDYDPMAHLGGLIRISPCEFVHAAVDGCFMAIDAGASDEVVRSWKKAFIATTFVFKFRVALHAH